MDGLFWTSRWHWWEQVSSTVIEFHPSITSGSRRARTWIARLVDRDANDCAISPPPIFYCWCICDLKEYSARSNFSLCVWMKFQFRYIFAYPEIKFIYTEQNICDFGTSSISLQLSFKHTLEKLLLWLILFLWL